MIDSHAHIYLEHFKDDLEDMLSRSEGVGVKKIFMPNIDHTSIDQMLETESRFPNTCSAMMGLHPCSVKKGFEKELYIVEEWLNKRNWSAVGEIGLDLYWDQSTIEYQKEALRIQINWAIDKELPFVLHCRDAFPEMFELLSEFNVPLKGVFHAFNGGEEEIKKVNELNMYIGIGGVITFKKQETSANADKINKEKLMLETDSPYLTPAPNRGKRNEPGYLDFICKKLASDMNLNPEELEEITDKNALEFFANV